MLSGLSSQALLEGQDSGGQLRTAPLGQHSQSISSKQGKLIHGPSTLLMGVNTTLQLQPCTAVESLWGWALQAAAGVQAELLCCPSPATVDGSEQSLWTSHSPTAPLSGNAPWDVQQMGCPWTGSKKKRCRQAVSQGLFPTFNPLNTTQQ